MTTAGSLSTSIAPQVEAVLRRSATEHTYEALKRALIDGSLSAGPLDIRRLGDRFRVSATPVREALARLASEGLVTFRRQRGYAVAAMDAQQLRDLYHLDARLVGWALRDVAPSPPGAPQRLPTSADACYADRFTGLVETIARAQANLELTVMITRLEARLAPARRCEPLLLQGTVTTLSRLERLWADRRIGELQLGLAGHLGTCAAFAEDIARLCASRHSDDVIPT